MKKILSLILFLFFAQLTHAQTKRVFILDSFTPATVKLKPRGSMRYLMNYDACNGKMFFMQGEEMMELTNTANVDTIIWGERKFIPHNRKFAEVIQMSNGKILVEWIRRDIVVGKKGALGQRTGGTVYNLQMHDFTEPGVNPIVSRYTPYDTDPNANDIVKRSNRNIYYIEHNGQEIRISNEKSLLKLYPSHAEDIKKYKKSNKINFRDATSALLLINYAMGQ